LHHWIVQTGHQIRRLSRDRALSPCPILSFTLLTLVVRWIGWRRRLWPEEALGVAVGQLRRRLRRELRQD
jgi:hypothetical protein